MFDPTNQEQLLDNEEVDSSDICLPILLLENKESQQELSMMKNIHARFLELLSAASGWRRLGARRHA
jgi:hypothetical protein